MSDLRARLVTVADTVFVDGIQWISILSDVFEKRAFARLCGSKEEDVVDRNRTCIRACARVRVRG